MPEAWQDIQTRAQATYSVWNTYFPTLQVGTMTPTTYNTAATALSDKAQERNDSVQAVDEARQAREFGFAAIHVLDVKVPALIKNLVDDDSGLLDDLGKVYAIVPNTPDNAVARGRVLLPVWRSADAWLAAQTPPRAEITRGGKGVDDLEAMLNDFPTTVQTAVNAEGLLGTRRGNLRRDGEAVERTSVRAYGAMKALADPGTAAYEALELIPTNTGSLLPETLGIKTFSQGGVGGLNLLIAYEPYSIDEGDVLELQWMIEGVDPGWDHSAAYDPSGNTIGPFTVGQVVKVRTKVTNEHGSREGGPRQLTILPPVV